MGCGLAFPAWHTGPVDEEMVESEIEGGGERDGYGLCEHCGKIQQIITPLKEAERLFEPFLGLVAHELRTPLAVLKGFAQTLLRHCQGARGRALPLAPWQQEALNEIDVATDRLNRLTEDLLDVVRLQSRRLVLHREAIDLVTITRQVLAQMGQRSSRHQFTLSTSSPSS